MSKREIRAKRLVAAVLLAISVQMWSAPPLWAAEESVQTETSATGETKKQRTQKQRTAKPAVKRTQRKKKPSLCRSSATVRARLRAATTASCRWLMPQTPTLILAARGRRMTLAFTKAMAKVS